MRTRLILWSLRHRRARRVLDVLSIAITAGVVMVFVSVMNVLMTYVTNAANRELTRVLIMPKLAGREMPLAMHATLEGVDGVQLVQRYRITAGRHASGATYLVAGEEESGVELNTDFFPVEAPVIAAWKAARPTGAIVTEQTAKDLNLTVGAAAEVPTAVGPMKIDVVGISYNAPLGHRIVVHFDYLQELAKDTSNARFRVFTKPDDYPRVAQGIEERTRNSPTPVQAVSSAQFAANFARRAGTIPAVLGFLSLFLLLTTALTIANNFAISIRERRTEIGTMRVMGYQRSAIVTILVGEAIVLGILGGLVAAAITYVAFRGGVQLTPGQDRLLAPVTIGALGLGCGLVVAIVLPLIGVLAPALKETRLALANSLRDVA